MRIPGPEVVAQLADALLFDAQQAAWLQQLATHTSGAPTAPAPEIETLAALVTWHSVGPAYAINHRFDLIAANTECPPSLLEDGNLCRWLLGNVKAQLALPDWEAETSALVGAVRAMQAHHPHDPYYEAMMRPLADRHPLVDQLWRQTLHVCHPPTQSTCRRRDLAGTVKTWTVRRVQPLDCGYIGLQAALFSAERVERKHLRGKGTGPYSWVA